MYHGLYIFPGRPRACALRTHLLRIVCKSDYVDVMDVYYLRETRTTSSYTDCMQTRVDKTNSPSRVQTHFDASRPAKRLYRNRRIHQNLFSDRDRVDLPLPGRPMIINTLDVVCLSGVCACLRHTPCLSDVSRTRTGVDGVRAGTSSPLMKAHLKAVGSQGV
jgi:hypothetical protein